MDWPEPGRSFLRCLIAVFLFACARNLRLHGGGLGHVFLQFRAAECLRRAFFHAGRALAQPGTNRLIFFSALDR